MAKYLTKDDDMLDAICAKHYGRTAGAVEAVLEANPGLANKARSWRRAWSWCCRSWPSPSRTRA